jgi:hypothetical protein
MLQQETAIENLLLLGGGDKEFGYAGAFEGLMKARKPD